MGLASVHIERGVCGGVSAVSYFYNSKRCAITPGRRAGSAAAGWLVAARGRPLSCMRRSLVLLPAALAAIAAATAAAAWPQRPSPPQHLACLSNATSNSVSLTVSGLGGGTDAVELEWASSAALVASMPSAMHTVALPGGAGGAVTAVATVGGLQSSATY